MGWARVWVMEHFAQVQLFYEGRTNDLSFFNRGFDRESVKARLAAGYEPQHFDINFLDSEAMEVLDRQERPVARNCHLWAWKLLTAG